MQEETANAVIADDAEEEFVFDVYANHEPIPLGYYAGTITGLKRLGKRMTTKHGEKEEIAIIVTLDEKNADGSLRTVKVKVNWTILEGSSLRKLLIKLGFPPDNKRFDLACIKGLKVDVFVTHKKGKIPGVSFAEVEWDDLDLPGRRTSRIQVTRVKDGAR